MASPGEFYASLPPVCKTWGTTLFAATLATTVNLLHPAMLALSLPHVFGKFQVWRLLTGFLWAGPFGFPFFIELLMIVQFAVKVEKDVYEGRPADFLFLLIFGMLSMLAASLLPFFAFPFLTKPLVSMMIYIWSRHYPNQNVNLMGLLAIPGFYLPWVFLFLDLIMGKDIFLSLLGYVVGHLFYFLDSVYPAQSGRTIIVTPRWVHWIIMKWAQNAPDMFPDAARQPPAEAQRVYLRPAGSAGGAPASQSGTGGAGPAGGPGRPAPAPAAGAQPSSTAFRGRSYRLDRD